ncbi:sugar-binding transcriptional regulator [Alkalihalobacterium alkalinitrilicum]|uniref:sugar-binding transcriptional regulator n=1 Tax=Alkalihalobacterium alkalinitrilicum TaxID=427920 RepID=UPI00099543F3|nr:sugar-binding domain-containing protein [Alkalihalobacterium alkalinitrilicum]
MNNLFDIQQKLLPDLLEVLLKRYRILQYIRLMEPIGRRSLSSNMDISERILRGEVTFLKDQRLIHVGSAGMNLTSEGKDLLLKLEGMMKDLLGLKALEQQLEHEFRLDKVIVVPGDSDQFDWVKKEMGRACVHYLKKHVDLHSTVAVTGGSTVAAVSEMMSSDFQRDDLLFVPARGGIGEEVENQANTICAQMARQTGSSYRLLHVPDQLSEETYSSLIAEPSVQSVLGTITSASVVIHGIGEAKSMAQRRGASEELLQKLIVNKAVAEAFGYYFGQLGDIIHRERTIGLQLEHLDHDKQVIAIAGGASKNGAISAYLKNGKSRILITDEGAAKKIININNIKPL